MPAARFSEPVTALLFDMDNTLFDLIQAQVAACTSVARHLGHDDGDDLFLYFLNTSHGFESTENIRQYMQERRIPTNGMYETACRIYHTEKIKNIVPYPGVMQSVREIKSLGHPMVIVTDAEKTDAVLRLEKCGLLPFFDSIVSYDVVKKKKPAPEPFLFGLDALHARPENALYIGDSPRRDIEPCQKLGIRTVYARYGDRFSKTRPCTSADFIIDTMKELPDIIRSLSLPRA
jgi:putative hydrolase of the HAD superfamily